MKRLIRCRKDQYFRPSTKPVKRTESIYRQRQKMKNPSKLHIKTPGYVAHRLR